VSLKDRAAVFPAGFAGDAAYWIDEQTGAWVTSTYYRDSLPKWAQDFNSTRPAKYWDREWKDAQGAVLRSTAHRKNADGSDAGFYSVVGSTAFANEYEFEFAKELMVTRILAGATTDFFQSAFLPTTSLARVGPDSPEMQEMASISIVNRLHHLPRSPDRTRQCVDRPLGGPWRFFAARRHQEVTHSCRPPRLEET
jgi:hypothetical protein